MMRQLPLLRTGDDDAEQRRRAALTVADAAARQGWPDELEMVLTELGLIGGEDQ